MSAASESASASGVADTSASLNGVLMSGWFSEVNTQWPGQAMSLEIESTLLDLRSEYQHVVVYKSKTWGNVLVLDGVIQLTERDEMAYQEMIAHLPLFSHAKPLNVLIIGGGDGGVIRECVKHDVVQSITICEIDTAVIDAGKKYFPSVASAWDDPRVHLHCGDGAVFLAQAEQQNKYDVIITDSSDPVGPAQSLFESPFYRAMYAALRAGGKICTQAESIWINLDLISKLMTDALDIFANAEYATTQIPTYPAGQIGFLLCSKAGANASRRQTHSCAMPVRKIPRADQDKFRFYTSELHAAAFVLPAFVQRKLDAARDTATAKKTPAKSKRSAQRQRESVGDDEDGKAADEKKAKTDAQETDSTNHNANMQTEN